MALKRSELERTFSDEPQERCLPVFAPGALPLFKMS
jgi:hypothetical protein